MIRCVIVPQSRFSEPRPPIVQVVQELESQHLTLYEELPLVMKPYFCLSLLLLSPAAFARTIPLEKRRHVPLFLSYCQSNDDALRGHVNSCVAKSGDKTVTGYCFCVVGGDLCTT